MNNTNPINPETKKERLPSSISMLDDRGYRLIDSVVSYPSDFLEVKLYKKQNKGSSISIRFNGPKPIGVILGNNYKDLPVLADPKKGKEEHTDMILVFDQPVSDRLIFFNTSVL